MSDTIELFLPAEPTTEGRAHWYVVCAKDEQKANLVGPFFSIEGAQEEVRIADRLLAEGVKHACDRPHFITPGPMPDSGALLWSVKRPCLYNDNEGSYWFEEWAYYPTGELWKKREAWYLGEERLRRAVTAS